MSIEKGTKYFRDDTERKVRQVSILPGNFPFRILREIAQVPFRTSTEMECIIITPRKRLILTPEYIKHVQALPYEQTMNHILQTAIQMRRASSIHIIYKAPGV